MVSIKKEEIKITIKSLENKKKVTLKLTKEQKELTHELLNDKELLNYYIKDELKDSRIDSIEVIHQSKGFFVNPVTRIIFNLIFYLHDS